MIAKIVADAQAAGAFREDVDPEFASMWFYGAIEQLLSGWVFELIPGGEADFDRAREMVVETICGGLETPATTARGPTAGQADLLRREPTDQVRREVKVENDMLRRLLWTGLLAADRGPGERAREPGRHRDLGAGLQGGSAGVSPDGPQRPAYRPTTTGRSASSSSTSPSASRS